jgi:hypothetical protein
MADVDQLVSQLQARQRADVAELAPSRCASCTPEQRLGLTFTPGDRVVDLVSGQKGIVRAGLRETRLV